MSSVRKGWRQLLTWVFLRVKDDLHLRKRTEEGNLFNYRDINITGNGNFSL